MIRRVGGGGAKWLLIRTFWVCVSQRQARLLGVLQRAHDGSLLREDFYANWVRKNIFVRFAITRLSSVRTSRCSPKSLDSHKFYATNCHSVALIDNFLIFHSKQLKILLSVGDAAGAAAVARGAVERHGRSVSVWSLSLQALIQLESADVGQLFLDALTHIDPKVVSSPHKKLFSVAYLARDNAVKGRLRSP